jgi:hypothetical protein
MDKSKTYFCLGNGERGCDGCGQEKNWQELNKLPDEYRKRAQEEFTRVDDTDCILRGRPFFVPSDGKVYDRGGQRNENNEGDLVCN